MVGFIQKSVEQIWCYFDKLAKHGIILPELGIRNVCKKLVISLYFCNFIVENQSITINITMITKDKITEIFCIADDFCKEFELETDKIGLSEKNKGCHRHRRWRMSKSEIITILICFHFNSYRNFRHYYTFFVKEHLADLFPNQLSYTSIPQHYSLWGTFIYWSDIFGIYPLIWEFSGVLGSCIVMKSPTQTNGEVWKTTKNDVYSMKTSA